ncbi:FkbM family methyltransferase [Geobacillus sp. LEMMY01]|uniref:FkbM family methyltransferase n=1 Tax=Geobacillus sp. LEMMY01 TaxID=1954237 RepID=UPI0009AED7D5|nr:FkbM family methyltransferase [Geobacillus sp. LEMMY01]
MGKKASSELSRELEKIKKQIKILMSQGFYHEALTVVNESMGIVPTDADLYSIKAVILIILQQIEEAKETLEEGLVIDPNHVDCLYNLAYIYEQYGQLGSAERLYRKILNISNETELINELIDKIDNLRQILRKRELIKQIESNKFPQKQELVLKDKSEISERLHVVYVLTHVGICGGVKIILEHANRLVKSGIKVSLVCHYPKPKWYPVEADYIEVPFDMELSKGIPKCDVIVATYWDHIQTCIETKIAPVVYFEQGDFHLFDYENMDENLKNFIYQQYQLPKFIYTVSNQAANIIKTIYKREATVIHNAIDSSIFNTKNNEINQFPPYILMMGDARIKFKGLDQIIEAYKKVKMEFRDILLYWVTPSAPPNEYKKEVDQYFVNPPQSKIADLYRGAKVFVSASHYESFSLPVLEAMACGCPVVTTENAGVREYAVDNYNALVAPIGDSCELSKRVLEILKNNELKNRLIINGLSTSKKFNWDNTISRLLEYYKGIAGYKVKNTQRIAEAIGGSNMHGVYIGDNRMLIKTVWGGKLITSNKDMSLMPDLVTFGLIEGPLTKFFLNNIKDGDTFVDVGANIGYYTILAGFRVGASGKVIAFEPNHSVYSLLMDNVAINYLADRVKLFNSAVYSQEGEIPFYTTERFAGNASIHQPDKKYYDYFLVDKGMEENRVKAIALDTFLHTFIDESEMINFIKIDVEGGEYHCFLGMQGLIQSKRIKTIIFEINKLRSKKDSEKLYKLLKEIEKGYRVKFGVINNEGLVNEFPLEQIFQYDFVPFVLMEFLM